MEDAHYCWSQCCDLGPHACICGNDCEVTMTDNLRARLEEDQRIIAAAYPGPWQVGAYSASTNSNYFGAMKDSADPSEPGPALGEAHLPDAEFIAHARTGYPSALRALQAVLEIHSPDRHGDCEECGGREGGVKWPCYTRQAAQEVYGDE